MRFIDERGFEALLAWLRRQGYELIGPMARDGTIVLDRIEGPDDLPQGVREVQEAGTYHLEPAPEERRRFAYSRGPDSAKRFLFPPREIVDRIHRADGRLDVVEEDEQPRYAFVGLRACDLAAIAVQDRVFLTGPSPDRAYAARRGRAFLLGVDCAEPGSTCFCASMGSGPACTAGFDLALTELSTGGFLARAASVVGREALEAIPSRTVTPQEELEPERIRLAAVGRMGRTVEADTVHDLLARNREHPEWQAVAARCLGCTNCTAVCPTCFCHDVVDAADLLGSTATRTREWASCFSREFSHTAGGDVRISGAARYRQWLTHKFSGWIDQFGTSGCVGCGRCITWCPVGIDVTQELAAIRDADGAGREAVPA